ncbi:MAG: DUF2141 domain-containing protein, partial [Deltaproteobacteria bacterium]
MKTWGIRLLLASVFILALFLTNTLAGETAGTLNVNIEGFPNSEGYAMVALFGSEQAYAEGSPKTVAAKVKVEDQKALAVFVDLQYGIYAVAVYHDTNANGKMDKNFLGIPKESYGHSNNAAGSFGPPPF